MPINLALIFRHTVLFLIFVYFILTTGVAQAGAVDVWTSKPLDRANNQCWSLPMTSNTLYRASKVGNIRSLKIESVGYFGAIEVHYSTVKGTVGGDKRAIIKPGEKKYINVIVTAESPIDFIVSVVLEGRYKLGGIRITEYSNDCNPPVVGKQAKATCFAAGKYKMEVFYTPLSASLYSIDSIRYVGAYGHKRTAAIWRYGWLDSAYYNPTEKSNYFTVNYRSKSKLIVTGENFTMSVWDGRTKKEAGFAKTCKFQFQQGLRPIITNHENEPFVNIGWYVWLTKR